MIFSGVPTPVAVGTEANQIVATSASGALAQWRRNNVDVKMGLVENLFARELLNDPWVVPLGKVDWRPAR